MIDCPHCDRDFGEANDAYNHIKAKHGKRAGRSFRAQHMPEHRLEQPRRRSAEPSYGERLVEAIMAASCGEEVDEEIELMFPDEIAEARRGV